jgi:small-conductance mechanosensitive channel
VRLTPVQLLLAQLPQIQQPSWLDALRQNAQQFGLSFVKAAVVFLAFWLVASVGRRLIAYAAPRVKADTSVVLLLSRLCYYGVLVFGLITALDNAGLEVGALIAGLGLTGFALGFALKDVLSNFVSGVMLLAYRPFRIGDVIEMNEFLGTIEDIRIRDTLVRTADGRLVIIPNTKLITEVVVNHTDAGGPHHGDAAGALRRAREARRAAAAVTTEDEAGDSDVRLAAPPERAADEP